MRSQAADIISQRASPRRPEVCSQQACGSPPWCWRCRYRFRPDCRGSRLWPPRVARHRFSCRRQEGRLAQSVSSAIRARGPSKQCPIHRAAGFDVQLAHIACRGPPKSSGAYADGVRISKPGKASKSMRLKEALIYHVVASSADRAVRSAAFLALNDVAIAGTLRACRGCGVLFFQTSSS